FAAAVQEGWMLLAVAGVVFSAVSLYYYFKIAVAMYMGEPTERLGFNESPALVISLIASVSVTLALGLYPGPLVDLARASTLLAR
ncbi:MAG: NADH-quinone oxidoreductase subunit N, partial [Acidobacteriota bacterium]